MQLVIENCRVTLKYIFPTYFDRPKASTRKQPAAEFL